MSQVNREYKSTIFALLFSDKEKLKSLCEAVSGEKIESADDIYINTLSDENGVQSGFYARLKNDVSFIFRGSQNLYEHQSTWSANMPIRMLLYYAELLLKEHPAKTLYSSKAISLETPRFIVFYNGVDRSGDFDEMTLNLSSHFVRKDESPAMELRVRVYNINKGHNKEAIIMRHFWEFDEDAYREAVYDDGFDAGVEKGIVQGRAQGIAQERAKLYSLVQDGDLAPDKAAAKLGLALDEFEKQMTAAGFKTPSAV